MIRSSTLGLLVLLGTDSRAQDLSAAGRRDMIVVCGLERSEAPPPSALDLGDGGFGLPASSPAVVDAPAQSGVVTWRSPGGALVRVAPAGVKLDLPSGRELMVDPLGRVHLREDGSATLSAPHGVDLVLGDGTRLTVRPGATRGHRAGMKSVVVTPRNGRQQVLWQSSRRVRDANARRGVATGARRSALQFHVLGDGEVLYEVEQRGPLLICQRVLCPVARRKDFPVERTVVLGDPLAESLRKLPEYLPQKSLEYPDGPRAAAALAKLAPLLFRRGVTRQADQSIGERIVAFGDGGMRLSVVDGVRGVVFVRLSAVHASQPVAEWIVGHTAELHLVRQDAGEPNTPRYFQRSVPVQLKK